MYCPSCGAPNDDNAWKCVKCGAVLQTAPPAIPTAAPVAIPNYLWQSIVCTLFCCWPLGIPAIVYAAQVNAKAARGDIEGARSSSKNAKTWCWVAFGSGLAFGVIYLAFVIISIMLQQK
jgi:hypothetical protein